MHIRSGIGGKGVGGFSPLDFAIASYRNVVFLHTSPENLNSPQHI